MLLLLRDSMRSITSLPDPHPIQIVVLSPGQLIRFLILVPSCIYATPEIASVGLTLDQAKEQGLAAKSHKILSSANGKSVLSLQERGFMKVIYLEETHVIIGAQLLCARATDMISEFAVAIAQKLTLEEMASVIRPHPSFSEIITQVTTL